MLEENYGKSYISSNFLAPSKIIGYKDIAIGNYIEGTKQGQSYMDRMDTVKQLKEWFQLIKQNGGVADE